MLQTPKLICLDPGKQRQNRFLTSKPVDLNPNYQPSKPKPVPPVPRPFANLTDGKTDDEALSALISMSKSGKRTAVYSGSKRYLILTVSVMNV
jgi:hypothetical protein